MARTTLLPLRRGWRPFHWGLAALLSSCAALLVAAGEAERVRGVPTSEYQFVRLIYSDYAGSQGFGRGWWRQDWPEAEEHFTRNLRRMTRVDTGESLALDLTDDALFDHPWLYATQTGYWDLGDDEVARLREYLLRGGFLMCDDFFGDDEMAVFAETMARVFPEYDIVELQDGDAVLHVVYDIDESVQIPGLRHLRGGGQVQQLPPPRWYGIYDDRNRLMVGINFNQDVGDSWEHANWSEYPQPMTAQGYRFGINYVIYAMTH